jgi:hypothetical protein
VGDEDDPVARAVQDVELAEDVLLELPRPRRDARGGVDARDDDGVPARGDGAGDRAEVGHFQRPGRQLAEPEQAVVQDDGEHGCGG